GNGTLHDQTIPETPHRPLWSADGTTIRFLVTDEGNSHVYAVPMSGETATLAIGGERVILGARNLPDGRTVFLATDTTTPAEVFVTDGTTERQRTHINRGWLDGKEVRAPERFRVRGDEDHEI